MIVRVQNPKQIIDNLKRKNKPFKIISTTMSKKIITENFTYQYMNDCGLKRSELGLIKQVKDYVIKNGIFSRCNKSEIQYINKADLTNGYKSDVYEIDLTKAYWNFFYSNGFTSKEIYLNGLNESKYSKKARLIALGNLAKVKTILNYNGKFFEKTEFEKSDTENLFFKVSKQTDAIMNKCKIIADKNYIFYWVDAIFIKGEETKNEICEYLSVNNLEHKVIKIDKFLKTNQYFKVWDSLHEKPRPFLFESTKGLKLSDILKH